MRLPRYCQVVPGQVVTIRAREIPPRVVRLHRFDKSFFDLVDYHRDFLFPDQLIYRFRIKRQGQSQISIENNFKYLFRSQ